MDFSMNDEQQLDAFKVYGRIRGGEKIPKREDIGKVCNLSKWYLSQLRQSTGGKRGIFGSFFCFRDKDMLVEAKRVADVIAQRYTVWALTPAELRTQAQVMIDSGSYKTALDYLKIARIKEDRDPNKRALAICNEAENLLRLNRRFYLERVKRCYMELSKLLPELDDSMTTRVKLTRKSFVEYSRLVEFVHTNNEQISA